MHKPMHSHLQGQHNLYQSAYKANSNYKPQERRPKEPHSKDYNAVQQPLQYHKVASSLGSNQIKKVRSFDNLPLMPSNRQNILEENPKYFDHASTSLKDNANLNQNPLKAPQKKVEPQRSKTKAENESAPFIEPGTQLDECFEQTLSTTCLTEGNVKTYFIAKALTGPMLKFASQECSRKQSHKKTNKKLPEIVEHSISGSLKPHLEGYSTITHEGLYRKTNEDKITIYLEENAKWFSIYDGHGGSMCSQFLKDNLHEFFFKQPNWKSDVPNALRQAFLKAEKEWKEKGDNSGSCALVIFIYGGMCYSANLGDSRAILGSESMEKCYQITKDHKPSNAEEQKRIIKEGGQIYQTTAITQTTEKDGTVYFDQITGPLRVYPGRLSTTRTFGDFEAKTTPVLSSAVADSENGELNLHRNRVVICEPEITNFDVSEHDYIFMASDGLWDKIDNKEVCETIKMISAGPPSQKETPIQTKSSIPDDSREDDTAESIQGQELYKRTTECLLMESMIRGSSDNISIIMVGLNDEEAIQESKLHNQKGNEHIKILSSCSGSFRQPESKKMLSSLSSSAVKKSVSNKHLLTIDKENMPGRLKDIDSRIMEINKNAAKLYSQSKRRE